MKNVKKMMISIPLVLGLSFSFYPVADAQVPKTTSTFTQGEKMVSPLKNFEGIGIVKVERNIAPNIVSDNIQFLYKGKTYVLVGNTKGLEKFNGKPVKIYGYLILDNRYYPFVKDLKIPKDPVIVVKKFEPVSLIPLQ